MSSSPAIGTVGWIDLTVADATRARDFYKSVVGWKHDGCEMGGYEDFTMSPPGLGAAPVAGVCHAKGVNTGLPACWLVYFVVADLDESVGQVTALGGAVLRPIASMGSYGRAAIIKDPSGAVCALFQSAA